MALLGACGLELPAAASSPLSHGRPTLVRWSYRVTTPEARFRLEALDPTTGAVLRTWWRDAGSGVPARGGRVLAIADQEGHVGAHYRLSVRSLAGEEWRLAESSTERRSGPAEWELLGSRALELVSAPRARAQGGPLLSEPSTARRHSVTPVVCASGERGHELGAAPGSGHLHLQLAGGPPPAVVELCEVPLPCADPPPPRSGA